MTAAWTNNDYIWDTGDPAPEDDILAQHLEARHLDDVERFEVIEPLNGGFTLPEGTYMPDAEARVVDFEPLVAPPEMTMIQARGRVLRGNWTVDVEQDMNYLVGEGLQNELADRIRREIDAEIIQEIRNMKPLVPDDLFDMEK